jgi:hypothetical protein
MGREEKQFYFEVDGIKIFGHADGVSIWKDTAAP